LLVSPDKVHTPAMSLKNAALLALVGSALLTILLVLNFVNDVLALMNGLIPAVTLLSAFIYAFAGLSVTVYFYVAHRTQ